MDEALGYDMIVKTVEVPPALSVELKGARNKLLTGVTGEYYVAGSYRAVAT